MVAEPPIEPEDVADLEQCLKQATQPRVIAQLQRLLDDWRAQLDRGSAPTPAPAPVQLPAAMSCARPVSFVPIESFGWDQDAYPSKYVCVYLLSGLDGVGELPKESVSCRFGADSFDLQIRGLAGKDYRLVKTALEHEINPAESKVRTRPTPARAPPTPLPTLPTGRHARLAPARPQCIVKKNRITLKLRKVDGQFGADHWTALTKKRPAPGGADKSDPSAGIMDMMKDLYEDGDDTMRKTIGEAMLKSRQERAGGSDLGF